MKLNRDQLNFLQSRFTDKFTSEALSRGELQDKNTQLWFECVLELLEKMNHPTYMHAVVTDQIKRGKDGK